MSSEFSCDYCSVSPRHPCYSREEAGRCPNASDRGYYLDMDRSDVIVWLQHNSRFSCNTEDQAVIDKACEIIEKDSF